ncbi:MAG: Malonyl CoA-acyl carrier protein transacylase [Anaerolineae bacterium]|nr:Malonyl CoA-acyl carrier protein transacylase [Anaerolineae bacterium]
MTVWSASAFVFPGQGSQVVGMGADVIAAYPTARAVFEEASDILGFDLAALCADGPDDALNDTINTQPALYVMGVALLRSLREARPDAIPALVAGHSLGELTALTAAGALAFADGVRLVRERGRLMAEAGRQQPGAMAAILGLDTDAVRSVCAQAAQQAGRPLVLANDNCPGQVVISGDDAALELGMTLAKEAGAKRAIKLAVSIAAHSPLMQSASTAFNAAVAATPFAAPSTPIIANVTAQRLEDADAVRAELGQQLTQSVRWTESVQAMRAAGIIQFYEFGPKDVLCGLVKRIDREAAATPINSAAALSALIERV